MAVTKIWKIEKRLDIVVDYVANAKKTNEANYYDLHKAVEYAKASYKTEQQLYVTSLNCNEFVAHCDSENVASYALMEKLWLWALM